MTEFFFISYASYDFNLSDDEATQLVYASLFNSLFFDKNSGGDMHGNIYASISYSFKKYTHYLLPSHLYLLHMVCLHLVFHVRKDKWVREESLEALQAYSTYYEQYDEGCILFMVYSDKYPVVTTDKMIAHFRYV